MCVCVCKLLTLVRRAIGEGEGKREGSKWLGGKPIPVHQVFQEVGRCVTPGLCKGKKALCVKTKGIKAGLSKQSFY